MARRRVSDARRMAEAGYEVPAPLAAALNAPEAPASALAKGKRHRHVWETFPADPTLDSCRFCGASRRVLTRQVSLF